MASNAVVPPIEEGKLLSEALNTVKIQVQQMKRHLVRPQRLVSPHSPDAVYRRNWIN